jgi:hypothetical protein
MCYISAPNSLDCHVIEDTIVSHAHDVKRSRNHVTMNVRDVLDVNDDGLMVSMPMPSWSLVMIKLQSQ